MTNDRWHRINQLFHDALNLPPQQRQDFILRASDGDQEVKNELASLLNAYQEDGDFLLKPALEVAARIAADAGGSLKVEHLGIYQILGFLERGGMGEVYLAKDTRLGRRVAIKILPAGAAPPAGQVQRFIREAQAASALNHPNVVSVHDVGDETGVKFIVMEYVQGRTVAEMLKEGPIQFEEVLNIAVQVVSALAAAHAAAITHRDIKPSNIMVTPQGLVKVMDFGAAKFLGADSDADSESRVRTTTSAGQVLGTLHYMSPEQLLKQNVDFRTDIFSLGVTLYEMAAGVRPFDGDTPAQIVDKILHAEPSAVGPPKFDRVIAKCLAKDANTRYRSVNDLLIDLKAIAPPGKAKPKRRPLSFAMAFGLVLAILTVLFLLRPASNPTRPSVAVLGFTAAPGQIPDPSLATSISERFRTELAATGMFRTIPDESVERAKLELSLPTADTFGGSTLGKIRANLGADYVLLGSFVQLSNEQDGSVRVDAKLQNAVTGDVVASVMTTGPKRGLFDLVSAAGSALNSQLGFSSKESANGQVQAALPSTAKGTRLYSEGLARLRRFDALAASRSLEEAIKEEQGSPLIRSALAEAWQALGLQAKAAEEARKALDAAAALPREMELGINARYQEVLGQWDEAAEVYQSLWTVFHHNPEWGLRLAETQTSANHGSLALETIKNLRNIPQLADDPRVDIAEAAAAESLGQPGDELDASNRAIAKAQRAGATLLVARAQLKAGWALFLLNRWDEAAKVSESARTTFSSAGDRFSEANAVKLTADILDDQGNHIEAKRTYDDAIAIFRSIGHQRGMAVALNNQGEALRSLGDLDGAKSNYEKANELAKIAGDWKLQANTLNGIGSIRARSGDLEGAQRAYEEAVAQLRKAGAMELLCGALINLAFVLQDEGYLDEAMKQLDETQTIAAKVGDQGNLMRAIGNKGELFLRKGELRSAAKQFSDQKNRGSESKDDRQLAIALLGLGQVDGFHGDLKTAISKFQQAIGLHQTLKEEGSIAEVRLSLAEAELDDNNVKAAIDQATAAATYFRNEKEIDQEALAYALLALSHTRANRSTDAGVSLNRAEALLPKIQHVARRLSVEITIAEAKAMQGKGNDARRELETSHRTAIKLGSVPHQLKVRRDLCVFWNQDCSELEKDALRLGFLLFADTAAKRKPAKGSS